MVSAPRATAMESVARGGRRGDRQSAPRRCAASGCRGERTVQNVVAQLDTLARCGRRPRCLPLVGGHSALDQFDSGRVGAEGAGLAARGRRRGPCTRQRCSSPGPPWRRCAPSPASARCWRLPRRWSSRSWGSARAASSSSTHVLDLMRLDASPSARPSRPSSRRAMCADASSMRTASRLGAPTDQRVLAVTFSELLRILPRCWVWRRVRRRRAGVLGVLRSGAIHTAVFDVEPGPRGARPRLNARAGLSSRAGQLQT